MNKDRASIITNSQLKEGYKQTEVGIIPEDWDVDTFQNVATLERGKFTARPRNDPKYYGGDIPFIQTGDVANSNGKITTFSQTLNQAGLNVSKLFPAGTLFFTIAANIGDVGFASFDTACPDSLIAIKASKNTNKYWLFQELKSRKQSFENLATNNAQLNINLEKLRPYLLPIPPLAEQEAIACTLSDIDELIESLDRLLTKKRQIKQGAMQDLLRSKDGWSKEEILNILSVIMDYRGRTPKKLGMEWGGGDIRALSAGNVKMGWIDFESEAYFGSEQLHQKWMTQGDTKKDDILVTTEAPLGNVSILPDSKKYILSQRVISLRPNPQKIDNKYLYHYISSSLFQDLLKKDSSGSTATGIQRLKFEKIPVLFPSLSEQIEIANILSDMDAEIGSIESKLTKTRQLKQGMMHELLTGRIRLVDPIQ